MQLEKISQIVGTTVCPDVAIIYDWENLWAMNDAQGPRRGDKGYLSACKDHYRAFWQRGIPVDIIDMEQDLQQYKLVVAPMLYMLRDGVDRRIADFVKNGGTFVTTYWSGIVDENDLVILGGWPGGKLREVLGIWAEEIDALYEEDRNTIVISESNSLGLSGEYVVRDFCDLIHLEHATSMGEYKSDFYAGRPALTVNDFGTGKAYYIAANPDHAFKTDFYDALDNELNLLHSLDTYLPYGISAQVRSDGHTDYIFIMNFNSHTVTVDVGEKVFVDHLTGEQETKLIRMECYCVKVLTLAV
jgi:beta-galactosidase